MTGARGQSRGHSAHIGAEVVVHYRWHPLYGRCLRRHCSKKSASGEVVHVEAAINGQSPARRRREREVQSKPLLEALHAWPNLDSDSLIPALAVA